MIAQLYAIASKKLYLVNQEFTDTEMLLEKVSNDFVNFGDSVCIFDESSNEIKIFKDKE